MHKTEVLPETVAQRVEPAPVASAPVVPERAVAKAGNWFVVVATYAQKEAAEKRALSMTRSAPRFKAEVYAPALDGKPYYLVVIGSNLSRDAAAALKERARASGFARDAYVTQFSR